MASISREHIRNMTSRDIKNLRKELGSIHRRQRQLLCRLKQTDSLLQGTYDHTLTKTPIEWSLSGVDAETQTDECFAVNSYREGDCSRVQEDPMISAVYKTLESVQTEMTNKGINNVFLSDWIVSLLATIRRLNPVLMAFTSYYYENEARTLNGSGLHMLKDKASAYFMSALDMMCTYSSGSTERDMFPDSEVLVHYSVAYSSRLSGHELSYAQFCHDPLAYNADQLSLAIDATITDIVEFTKTHPPNGDLTVSVNWFPPSYVQVVDAVNDILQSGDRAVKNSVLVQFLPLSNSGTQRKTDMAQKEKIFLGLVIRTALMWYMTFNLSSTVQPCSRHAYHGLLDRCITTDPIVVQSLYNANKGPYISTGMLVPGLFAYLFYICKEPGMTVKLGSHSANMPFSSRPNATLTDGLQKWCTEDFGVRGKMAQFIAGDSVLKSDVSITMPAFGGTPKSSLQGQIDSALILFMREMFSHENAYKQSKDVVISYVKELASTRDYLQTSEATRLTEYNLADKDKSFKWMEGFLKNPFLYKLQHTQAFDTFGRSSVQTNRKTVVSSPVVSSN